LLHPLSCRAADRLSPAPDDRRFAGRRSGRRPHGGRRPDL